MRKCAKLTHNIFIGVVFFYIFANKYTGKNVLVCVLVWGVLKANGIATVVDKWKASGKLCASSELCGEFENFRFHYFCIKGNMWLISAHMHQCLHICCGLLCVLHMYIVYCVSYVIFKTSLIFETVLYSRQPFIFIICVLLYSWFKYFSSQQIWNIKT